MSTITPEFRVSFPNVFTAKKNDLSGKDEFSLMAVFSKDADLTALKEICHKALEKRFGSDQNSWPKNIKTPFREQSDRAKLVNGKLVMPDGFEEGGLYLNLKSSVRPGLVGPDMQAIIDTSDFYAGCFARASVSAYAYDAKGNRGVALGLNNLQKTRDGDPLGGRTRAEEDFAPIANSQGSAATDLFN